MDEISDTKIPPERIIPFRVWSHFKKSRQVNLCAYFILPLVNLNTETFGPFCFQNAFLSTDGKYIFVYLNYFAGIENKPAWMPMLSGMWMGNHRKCILRLSLPASTRADVEAFCKGRYSRMSAEAKNTICNRSGLMYVIGKNGLDLKLTDCRLLGLLQHEKFRDALEAYLDIRLSPGDELLSVPPPESFLDGDRLLEPGYFVFVMDKFIPPAAVQQIEMF